jgi:protocatechuate 3,4-dioxygenase beta subunit
MLAVGGSLLGGAVALVACGRSSSGDGAASTATAGSGSAASPTGSSGTTATTGAAGTISTAGADASGLASGTPATTVFTAADFVGLGTCQLLPELTQGPFPTTVQIERRDITEGLPGMPLRVGIRVVDESCVPIPGATVEVWHCDVDGDYSEYEDGYTADDGGADTTFLRGSQVANAEGIVEFVTNWPGWYSGRAVHIHSKVHIDDSTVLTTQFLFDDALNEEVLATGVYASHGQPDTTNASDGVTGGNGAADGLVFTVSDDSDLAGKRALIVVGLDPAATSSQTGGGTGGGPGGGGPGGPGGGAPG